jgi:iron(III) transport system substrate-binding protein
MRLLSQSKHAAQMMINPKKFQGHLMALAAITVMSVPAITHAASPAEEVNLYTTREPQLIAPMLELFTANTGIKVNTVFVKDGLIERVKTEGNKSSADVLMTVDIGNLLDLVDANVVQPIDSKILNEAIPAPLRGVDNNWFALSLRDRVLYANVGSGIKTFEYESLADPKYKGQVCIRSGQHPYNTALIAAMIAHNGEAATETWLRGVKANLARKATGGDRNVARDILGGICNVGIANAYYAGQMKSAAVGSEQRTWGDAIEVIQPTFRKSGGTFVNISGAAVAKSSPNRENAVKLMEFLVSDAAQALYADTNFEYPVKAGVKVNAIVESFGILKPDTLPLTEVAKYRKRASELVDKVGFDQ